MSPWKVTTMNVDGKTVKVGGADKLDQGISLFPTGAPEGIPFCYHCGTAVNPEEVPQHC